MCDLQNAMITCAHCHQTLKEDSCITCIQCKTKYHLACVNITAETVHKNKSRYAAWVCATCKTGEADPSKSSNSCKRKNSNENLEIQLLVANAVEQGTNAILSKLAEMSESMTGMKTSLDNLTEKVTKVEESNVNISKRLDEQVKETEEVKATNKDLKQKCETLEERCKQVELKMCKTEQYLRDRNVIVTGHDGYVNNHTNIYHFMTELFNSMEVNVAPDDIVVAHPLKARKGNAGLLIQFRNKEVKRAFMRAKTKAMVKINGEDKKIFINHQLSEYYSNLLFETKKIAKTINAKFVWYANGKILVRKEDKGEVIAITELDDLKKLDKFTAKLQLIASGQTVQPESTEQNVQSVPQTTPTVQAFINQVANSVSQGQPTQTVPMEEGNQPPLVVESSEPNNK